MESKIKNFVSRLINNATLICGVLTAIVWIVYRSASSTNGIEFKPELITKDIPLSVCVIIISVVYGKLISQGGFNSAKNSPEFQSIARKKTETVKKSNIYKYEIIEYVKSVAKDNQKQARTDTLESFGLKYEKYFDEEGKLINEDYKKLKRKQRKAVYYCVNRIKIVIPNVFGTISGSYFGISKRKTQKKYEAKQDTKNSLTRAIFTLFSLGIVFILSWSIEGLLSALLQVTLWTASGVVERVGNYNFIMQEIAPQIIEDTLIINGYLETKETYKNKAEEEKA